MNRSLIVAALGALLAVGCLERRTGEPDASEATKCAQCHGDPARPGDALRRAAPPKDLLGATGPEYPGVGAHAIHLDASATHGAIACDECHVVPDRVDAPGHADHAGPATLTFGELARHGGKSPSYDPVGRICGNTYCHRGADAVWTDPRSSDAACGSCHGLPPPAPHPQSSQCSSCHGAVVDAARHIIAPALHVNGKVEQGPAACTACHGSGDEPAPPRDTHGNVSTSEIGVGAHAAHLSGGQASRALACTECHVVPTKDDRDHPKPGPAPVTLTGTAARGGHSPEWDHEAVTCGDTWCHGPDKGDARTSPKWTSGALLGCTSCHGAPPPAPHPQSDQCWSCHGAVVDSARHIVARDLHVNGTVDFSAGKCTDCHGSGGVAAPPKDTRGNVDVSAIGVGAHRVHLAGGKSGRALACTECHAVPAPGQIPAHADGLPAEVLLTGPAAAHGRAPAWDHAAVTCGDTWCHGPDPDAASSQSPKWTIAGQLGCTSCHGAPPAAPHPQVSDCSQCHGAVVADDDVTIVDRARHVNGVVDVAVPTSCTSCHGGATDAAPVPGTPGSGAHRTHLDGTARSRKVACSECHQVPATVLAAGHVDTPRPAELQFSGVAAANGASPSYSNGACSGTPCHGAVLPDGNASGGTNTAPVWSVTDGSQAVCGSCHALPPPEHHPNPELNPVCSACHKDIAPDNQTFTHPELHVDGKVTFEL